MTRPAPPTGWRWWAAHLNPRWVIRRYWTELALAGLVASFLLALLWSEVVIPIRSGQRGVYWSRFFGGTLDWVLDEGTFLKLPWDEIALYNVRQQTIRQETVLLSTDGMTLDIGWFVRYRPRIPALAELHRVYGPDYGRALIVPEVVSSLREILGNFRADQIYAEDEKGLLQAISTDVRSRLAARPVVIEGMGILKLRLPAAMAAAIVDKLKEEQRHLSYQFRLPSEIAEAKRLEIEATGLRRFRDVSGVEPLKWAGIEATVEISRSPNTKIILMGTDAKQLPIILNTESAAPAPASTGPSLPVTWPGFAPDDSPPLTGGR